MRLTYSRPAGRWTEALPIGNGRLGAMVFGGTRRSRYQINDDTCWTGSPATAHGALDELAGHGPAVLAELRAHLAAGDVAAATEAEQRLQLGWSQASQPLADLWLETSAPAHTDDYRRWLDLETATTVAEWSADGRRLSERAWVSAPGGALIIERRIEEGPGVDGRVVLTSPHADSSHEIDAASGCIVVRLPADIRRDGRSEAPVRSSREGASVTAAVAVALRHDGTDDGDLAFTGARRIVVVISSATDFAGGRVRLHGDRARVAAEARRSCAGTAALSTDELHLRHVSDHRGLSDRMTLRIGPALEDIDVEGLLAATAETRDTRALATAVFAYGRYLTIAGSRPGTRPLTLQGLWNDKLLPPWRGNYTTNINLEMNYWPTEAVALPECHEPLLDWLSDLARSGERTARELYGMSGWVAHHNSDIWGFSVPAGDGAFDPVWSMWPMAGVWLARHLRERWDFSGDAQELRKRWPLLRGAAEFALDWLVSESTGALGTSPSTSPENHFILGDGTTTGLTTSTAADLAMLRDLFSFVVAAGDALGIADEVTVGARGALDGLPRERITSAGRIAEWADDPVDAEPAHRHQSHLYGVMPGESVLPWRDPDLAAAALRSLDDRGRRTTGWSLAWRVALRARLRDATGAHASLRDFLAPVADPDQTGPSGEAGLYANLFCAHPPFQIDGNFGATAAILEMVVQSHGGRIALLPALPASWQEGSATGVRVRGGATLDLAWEDGAIRSATLSGPPGRSFEVESAGRVDRVVLGADGTADLVAPRALADLRGLEGLIDLVDRPFADRGIETLPRRLHDVLGVPARHGLPTVRDSGGWTRDGVDGRLLTWSTGFGPETEAWLLRPAGEQRPLAGVLALHCHGGRKRYGKEKIADGPDVAPSSLEGLRAELYGGRALANDIARAGYAVLVPDAFGWSSRRMLTSDMSWRATAAGDLALAAARADGRDPNREDEYDLYAAANEDALAKTLGVLGTSWGGVVARDDLIAADVLATRSGVAAGGVVAVGLSGGGARAALLTALSDRLRGAAVVAMMSTIPEMLDGHLHAHTWMMMNPGIGRVGDWPDIAASRAPRPLFVGYAERDALFPVRGMRAADRMISARYRYAGRPDRYRAEWTDAPHSFPVPLQAAFLDWLADTTERNIA